VFRTPLSWFSSSSSSSSISGSGGSSSGGGSSSSCLSEVTSGDCLENLFSSISGGGGTAAFRSQVTLCYCVIKQYCILLPAVCSDISCFSLRYKSSHSIALCFLWQLRCYTGVSSQFVIFVLIILYTVFLNFPLSVVT